MLAWPSALLINFYYLLDLVASSRLPLLMWKCIGAHKLAIGKIQFEFGDQIFFHKLLGFSTCPTGLGTKTP